MTTRESPSVSAAQELVLQRSEIIFPANTWRSFVPQLLLSKTRPAKFGGSGNMFIIPITTEMGNAPIIVTPPFYSRGIVKQTSNFTNPTFSQNPGASSQNESATMLIPINQQTSGWLPELFESIERHLYTKLLHRLDATPQLTSQSAILTELYKGGSRGREIYLKPGIKKDDSDVMWLRITKDALFFNAGDITIGETLTQLREADRIPKNTCFIIRITPKYLFIGPHGSLPYKCSVSYAIDQAVYVPGTMCSVPQLLTIDASALQQMLPFTVAEAKPQDSHQVVHSVVQSVDTVVIPDVPQVDLTEMEVEETPRQYGEQSQPTQNFTPQLQRQPTTHQSQPTTPLFQQEDLDFLFRTSVQEATQQPHYSAGYREPIQQISMPPPSQPRKVAKQQKLTLTTATATPPKKRSVQPAKVL